MANRPVFIAFDKKPFYQVYSPEFTWSPGFAVSQKQKNITELHKKFNQRFPAKKVLEISSKSMQELGIKLSAFNLMKYVPELGKSVPLECVFQGGKVFAAGGPYTDLYTAKPKDAKRDERLKSGGRLKAFFFDGREYPIVPETVFYDWLYLCALLENPELAKEITEYDAFTDIEFNPEKSLNCQARASAVFVALAKEGLAEKAKDFDFYLECIDRMRKG